MCENQPADFLNYTHQHVDNERPAKRQRHENLKVVDSCDPEAYSFALQSYIALLFPFFVPKQSSDIPSPPSPTYSTTSLVYPNAQSPPSHFSESEPCYCDHPNSPQSLPPHYSPNTLTSLYTSHYSPSTQSSHYSPSTQSSHYTQSSPYSSSTQSSHYSPSTQLSPYSSNTQSSHYSPSTQSSHYSPSIKHHKTPILPKHFSGYSQNTSGPSNAPSSLLKNSLFHRKRRFQQFQSDIKSSPTTTSLLLTPKPTSTPTPNLPQSLVKSDMPTVELRERNSAYNKVIRRNDTTNNNVTKIASNFLPPINTVKDGVELKQKKQRKAFKCKIKELEKLIKPKGLEDEQWTIADILEYARDTLISLEGEVEELNFRTVKLQSDVGNHV
eukprot:TRINITY_DN1101_c0_g1_i2.p1 TRINITY_DN1101_c0_g1~~TRINITY_DN1101_c0_g1_i2.p1  ORF type:complete len:415 (-),score=37.04 TRINITY_DN1101_c0_g1_i2:70-1218(-)